MEIAGNLVDKGLNSAKIIDDSFTGRLMYRIRYWDALF